MKSMKKIRIRSYEGEAIIYEKNTCNGCSKNRFPDRFRGGGVVLYSKSFHGGSAQFTDAGNCEFSGSGYGAWVSRYAK